MSIPQLRVVTFLCPSIPVEFFQSVLDVLEEKTGYQTTLQYEWRSQGSSENRIDMFESNHIDLAFMPSAGYICLDRNKNGFAELLPITPLFKHPKTDAQNVGTFLDVVIHSDKLKHSIHQILDLRGCRWACVSEDSLASGVMLDTLKKMGENITFFGSTHRATSHLEAVNMVLTKQVDVATIDSSALICNRKFLHKGGKDVVVLTSFGPYSPYAVVINSRIDGDLKTKIVSALEGINGKDQSFEKFGLLKFVPNHPNNFDKDKHFMKNLKSGLSKVPYY